VEQKRERRPCTKESGSRTGGRLSYSGNPQARGGRAKINECERGIVSSCRGFLSVHGTLKEKLM